MSDPTPLHLRPRRRVCFVIDKLAGRSGGAERILIETAGALAGRGHEVQIVTHEPNEARPFYPPAFGVMLSNLRRPRAMRSRLRRGLDAVRERLHGRLGTLPVPLDRLLWLSRHGAFRRRLEAHLHIHRPDVAIAFLPPAITALGHVAPFPGLRRIASLHNVPAEDLTNPERWDPSPLDRARRMEALAQCDAVTVLLPEFRDWFPEPMRRKIAVMPNPVPPISTRRRARAERGKRVLSVGRLAAVKRHDLLIEAWARLAADFPDWQLQIFGVGPDRVKLEALIATLGLEDKVDLMGHTDVIAQHYLSAAILCHPAKHEGWGLAVTEAMAAGLVPVGFADCPGVNQLIAHETNGLLVEPGPDRASRTAALAEALAGLMRDPERRAALGQAGPESMRAYAPDAVIDRWEALLHEASGGA